MGLSNAVSIVYFDIFIIEKYFLLFFMDFKLFMLHNNIMKNSEILNRGNLLKTCFKFFSPISS